MPRWRSALKRLLIGLLAGWLVVLMSGAPLPALTRGAASLGQVAGGQVSGGQGTSSERYPCESCACGCGTADYCWKSCCCHTLQQRIAWAKRNKVRPPESALEEAAAKGIDVSQWGVKSSGPSMLAYELPAKVAEEARCKELPPCCAARVKAAQEKAQQTPQTDFDAPSNNQEQEPAAAGVILLQALACQGLLEQWLSMGTGPLPKITTWEPNFECELVLSEKDILYTDWSPQLEPRPPRVGVEA